MSADWLGNGEGRNAVVSGPLWGRGPRQLGGDLARKTDEEATAGRVRHGSKRRRWVSVSSMSSTLVTCARHSPVDEAIQGGRGAELGRWASKMPRAVLLWLPIHLLDRREVDAWMCKLRDGSVILRGYDSPGSGGSIGMWSYGGTALATPTFKGQKDYQTLSTMERGRELPWLTGRGSLRGAPEGGVSSADVACVFPEHSLL